MQKKLVNFLRELKPNQSEINLGLLRFSWFRKVSSNEGSIKAGQGIKAGGSILAAGDIESGKGISAGKNIKAGRK